MLNFYIPIWYTYELGFELNNVGWYEMCAFSYFATFGKVSSAFRIGKVLLKNSSTFRFSKSLKRNGYMYCHYQ